MKILYVALGDDYGDPARGPSYEHINFHDSLVRMGHDVVHFDYVARLRCVGYEQMNAELAGLLSSSFDFGFFVLFEEQIDRGVLDRTVSARSFPIVNWFCDDHWRFERYSKYWTTAFDLSITTYRRAATWHLSAGQHNVLCTQWACNHWVYAPMPSNAHWGVTFVGQPHGRRREVIDRLRRAGIDVAVWGYGWKSGRLRLEEMISVFSNSTINLNLANASTPKPGFLRGRIPSQIKGRNFEVPGCGGFLLTDIAEDLGRYYRIGQEVAVFKTARQLEMACRYYLRNPEEALAIAAEGRERTLREHTYELRFHEIFDALGIGGRSNDAGV
jgi:spore maturation protein CgeB